MKKKIFVASLSGGKDSVAMVLRLIKDRYPLHYVVFYDTGMEFQAIYKVVESLRLLIENYGAKLIILKPKTDFLYDMLVRPVKSKQTGDFHYGMEWCGGRCRWQTNEKIGAITKFINSLDGEVYQYIGIAYDEPDRIKNERNKFYPLYEWKMTELDCLKYCRDNGITWKERNDVPDLYGYWDEFGNYIPGPLKRVSCWCCSNKNLEELRNIYHLLPDYWEKLKGLQSRIDRPFHNDKTIFQLEERFKDEDAQLTFDWGE